MLIMLIVMVVGIGILLVFTNRFLNGIGVIVNVAIFPNSCGRRRPAYRVFRRRIEVRARSPPMDGERAPAERNEVLIEF